MGEKGKMKIRKLTAALVAACLAMTAVGCGGNSTKGKYVFVTDTQGTDSDSGSALWQGIKEVTDAGEIETGLFAATTDTPEGYAEAFGKAAEEKPGVVIAMGEAMEVPFYEAATASGKLNFILFDGVPHPKDGGDSIPANAVCVRFAEHEEAFVAGYAAVCSGIRALGVLVGEENEINTRHVNGFVQGVKKAAEDMALESGSVTVSYEYAGSDELTPLRMSEALGMYSEGISLIYTTGENLVTAVGMAARNQEKYYATGGVDHTDDGKCLFSAVPVYNMAARLLLSDYSQGNFEGGTSVTYGYTDSCLQVKADFTSLNSFDQEKYDAIVSALMLGTVKPDEALAPSNSTAVTVSRVEAKDAQEASADAVEGGGAIAPEETGAENAGNGAATEGGEDAEGGEGTATGEEASGTDNGEAA